MMEQSSLMDDYELMMKTKESIGMTLGRDNHYIKQFILFCEEKYPGESIVKRGMIDEWISQKVFNSPKTQSNTISLLRYFTKFQNAIGKPSYVPDEDYNIHCGRYIPYIFTDLELSEFFKSVDTFPPYFMAPGREYIIPVLFRMMYCCGMRPAEPLYLLCEDVNLITGEIYIRSSKHKKDRHIIMSEDMRRLCVQYNYLAGDRKWFFQKWDGECFPTVWPRDQIKRCWKRTGLEMRQNLRPYDLRHNFATRNIMVWVENEWDVMSMLPYLSAYMGHEKYTHTLYYVSLLPERLKKSAKIDWDQFNTIYDEDGCYEED